MNDKEQKRITPEKHRKQIAAYRLERPSYEVYAAVMKRVLESACAVAIPEAFIQSRPKTISSFAEKCVRRFDRYPNAVKEMTDFCGARVIVQTLEQVKAVRQFIEANFEILERDDKGLQLNEDKFGYRDMHYIVRLRPDRCEALGITPKERKVIGSRRAEVQVRTWLQHAWADTLHDRIYKNSLNLPTDIRRTGALLAALMEEGDRNFNVMASELDGMVANYTAFASRDDVMKEIDVQGLILTNEPDSRKRPALALKLARLLKACGDYERVVEVLDPYHDLQDGNRCELSQYLGYALCKVNSHAPASPEFQRGQSLLEDSLALCERVERPFVPHLRKQESLHARALSWLGWVKERLPGREPEAREHRRKAHEHEPSNPYYLADMLGFEMKFTPQADLPATLRTVIREAVRTCWNHAAAGIELPYAYFTAGRLSLLLDQPLESLGYYARGVQHYLAGEQCFPADVLGEENRWLGYVHFGTECPAKCRWAEDLLALAARVAKDSPASPGSKKVLVMTGGAADMDPRTLKTVRPLIETALRGFSGTVVSGGTIAGVPGLVGEISSGLAGRGEKHFDLVAYIPKHLPHDVPKDSRYDRFVECEDDTFLPAQILRNWKDLLDDSVNPENVLLLGFGGGPLSALEYRLALAFGAFVGVVTGTGGAADAIAQDALWSTLPKLMPLPFDSMSVHAFVTQPVDLFGADLLEKMGTAFHDNYVANSAGRLPDNMKPWPKLKRTYKRANTEQARHSVQILTACGFSVRKAKLPAIFQDFKPEEIERMAEMEHGRWNIERLRDGWRFGPRDDARKLHDCLVPWSKLLDNIKKYDREAARSFPSILARAGLEVYRK